MVGTEVPQAWVRRANHPRIHVELVLPPVEDVADVLGALDGMIAHLRRSRFYLGYVGVGPNTPLSRDPVRRILERYAEGGAFSNVVGKGMIILTNRAFYNRIRPALEALGVHERLADLPEDARFMLGPAFGGKHAIKDLKSAIGVAVLQRLGMNVGSVPDIGVENPLRSYRKSFRQAVKPVKLVKAPDMPFLGIGVDRNGRVWMGLLCGTKLCHAIRPEIRLYGPILAAENPAEYYKLIINETRKRHEDYYRHVSRISREHKIPVTTPKKTLNELLRRYDTLSTLVNTTGVILARARQFLKRELR